MSDLATLKRETCDRIDALAPELIDISHQIHARPELAFHEHFAAGLLADTLDKHEVPATRNAFGLETAYASSFGEGGAEVAILSEYDALPGIGHACGHNIIATTGLGAALGLAALNGRLPGRIRYLGTPAEEMGGGKELMAQDGAFDGLDAAMMVHPAGIDLETMPCICVSEVRVTYHGKSAHASAMPHAGLNALDALVTAYQTLAQLRQHIGRRSASTASSPRRALRPTSCRTRPRACSMCAPRTPTTSPSSRPACRPASTPVRCRRAARRRWNGRKRIIWT
ncbi:M20/M25/M40 family metallo-hydrolase [Pyruvatibacter mobilis]|uniref:M20/M25/M40 family metallo-hydrolase n=1 Tax=Pyruvatibacter mobilis TaxID=1712261 RepID=UPI003BAACEC1